MKEKLIREILALDADTYMGIDDAAFLERMSIDELKGYLAEMEASLGRLQQ